MIQIKNRFQKYFALLRIQTGASTALAPLLGGFLMGQRSLLDGIILFFLGIFYHIFGFVLNEYVDVEVDKQSVDLDDKPLVSGSISMRSALILVILSVIGGYLLLVFFYRSPYPILFFSLSLLLGGIYDVFGKKIAGMDFVLAGGFFCICLTGASTVSIMFSRLVILVSFIYFFQIVFNNSIEGGLKDVDHDGVGGAKTLAQLLGVHLQNGRLIIPQLFLVFAFILRGGFFVLLVYLGFQPELDIWSFDQSIQMISVMLLAVLSLWIVFVFLKINEFNRSRLKRLFSFHEMLSFFMVIIVLSPLFELGSTFVLLILPAVWYVVFNIFLYGKPLEPNV